MKPIEELGISPTPWTNVIDTDNPFKWNSVWDSRTRCNFNRLRARTVRGASAGNGEAILRGM